MGPNHRTSGIQLRDLRIQGVSRLVLGFYRSEERGEEALREARKNGFRRSAGIHRASDGGLRHFHDGLGPHERAVFGVAMALVVAVLALIAGIPPWAVVPSALFGFLITWFGTLWWGLGIRNRVLRCYRGFVLPGESLVVVEGTKDEAADIIAVLRHIAHASVFAIRPKPGFTASTETAGHRRA